MLDDMPDNLYAFWVFSWIVITILVVSFFGYWICKCYQERRNIQPSVVIISRESFRRQLYPGEPFFINKTKRNYNYHSINH